MFVPSIIIKKLENEKKYKMQNIQITTKLCALMTHNRKRRRGVEKHQVNNAWCYASMGAIMQLNYVLLRVGGFLRHRIIYVELFVVSYF